MKNKITRFFGNSKLILKKYEPEIFLGFGIISSIGSIVAAGYAGYKLVDILKEHEDKMEEATKDIIKHTSSDGTVSEVVIEKQDINKKEIRQIYINTSIKMLKVGWPVIALETLSELFRCKTYSTLNKRYNGVVGLYNGLLGAFTMYRTRLIEEQGQLMDRHYMYGSEITEIEVEEIGPNNQIEKKKVTVENIDSKKVYKDTTSRIFGPDNPNWDPNPVFNRMFLQAQMEMLNMKLHQIGHVILNEVYYAIGEDDTPEGAVIGWLDKEGDGYIDFGIYNLNNEDTEYMNTVDGSNNIFLLEFNHDGVIFDKI